MIRYAGGAALGGAVCACLLVPTHAAGAPGHGTPVYEQGFEQDRAAPVWALGRTPEGLNDLSNCGAVILEQRAYAKDRAVGRGAYRLRLAFRGDGSANPTFYLPAPIPVDGPLYVSCYFKVLEQDPESTHRIRLLVWGEFPHDPQPTLGRLSTVETKPPGRAYAGRKPVWKGANLLTNESQPADNGWVFRRSGDIHQLMLDTKRIVDKRGMCLFAISVSIWGCRAGRQLDLLVDEIRLTRERPLLPPSAVELADAVAVFRRLGKEYHALGRRYADPTAAGRHAARYARLTRLAEQAARGRDAEAQSRFVSLVGEMQRAYYTLKIAEMSHTP